MVDVTSIQPSAIFRLVMYDPSQLVVMAEVRDDEIPYGTLEDGTHFPWRIELRGRYKNGPQLHWTVGVRDGKAVVIDMKFEVDPLCWMLPAA
jgi:hypothetical protein